jgi:hypothetical protein
MSDRRWRSPMRLAAVALLATACSGGGGSA